MQVFDLHSPFTQVGCQIFSHLLGESCDQNTLVTLGALLDLLEQVINLTLSRFNNNFGIHKASRTNDLFDYTIRTLQFILPGSCRKIDGLTNTLRKLIPFQRTIIHRGRKAETIIHQSALSGHVTLEHRPNLRNRHVGFIDDQNKIIREIIKQSIRRCARATPINMTRIVLDSRTRAYFLEHFEVVGRSHPKTLSLKQFSLGFKPLKAFFEFFLDGSDRTFHSFLAGNIVRCREKVDMINFLDHIPRHGMEYCQGINFIAEHFNPDCQFLVHRNDLNCVSTHPKGSAGKADIVPRVLHTDEGAEEIIALNAHSAAQLDHPCNILFRRTQTIDT